MIRPTGSLSRSQCTGTPPALGLYVHVPFCVQKCLYCDFNSGPATADIRREHLAALEAEIRNSPWSPACGHTVFFGGGTPSELSIIELTRITDALKETFDIEPGAEWTIECNPGTIRRDYFAKLRSLGFNRISLGVQSFYEHHLERLGRIHNVDEIFTSYHAARDAGMDNINLDLMFALPDQTLDEWRSDLRQAFDLRPEHLSLYNLTIEPNTEFGRLHAAGQLPDFDNDLAADMYELTMDMTIAAGFEQYEISNFARPGRQCAHNLIYWRNEPFIGFGVSAASYVAPQRWSNTGDWAQYAATAKAGAVPRATDEHLAPAAALGEEIMLRLRLAEGMSLIELSQRYAFDVTSKYATTLDALEQSSLIVRREDHVQLTRSGKLMANEVCGRFL